MIFTKDIWANLVTWPLAVSKSLALLTSIKVVPIFLTSYPFTNAEPADSPTANKASEVSTPFAVNSPVGYIPRLSPTFKLSLISISKGTKITRTKEMGVLNPSFMSVNLQQEVREKFEFYKSNYRVLIDEYNRRA